MGFHLRMSPEDAAAFRAACERAATNEQASQDGQRAAAAPPPPREPPADPALMSGSFVVVPPDAGPLIPDGVEYLGPEPPNPWLDGDRVRTDEPGWRAVGRQKVPRD